MQVLLAFGERESSIDECSDVNDFQHALEMKY
jgi:hypothetical protein